MVMNTNAPIRGGALPERFYAICERTNGMFRPRPSTTGNAVIKYVIRSNIIR